MNLSTLLLTKLSITPWAIHPGMFDIISNVLNKHTLDIELKSVTQVKDENMTIAYTIVDGKAIVPLHGVVLKKSMGMEGESGMVTTLNIENTLKNAVENRAVNSIILDMDSPGGTVDGVMEMAALIYELRQYKPIIGYANGLMCSAMYWIGAATERLYTYDTSHIGSIGVYMMHVDQSSYNDKEGFKVTYIKAGKFKTVGNPHESLTDESKAVLQKNVDDIYDLFIKDVAKYRGKTEEYVRENMADGKVFMGREAVEVGLVDEIRNFDGLIDESLTYSFLKGDSMFGKKLSDATVEDIKAENPNAYQSIINLGKEEVKKELEEQAKLVEEKQKKALTIRTFAAQIGQTELAEKLISEDKSVVEAFETLASTAKVQETKLTEAFETTAPVSAGSAGQDIGSEDEPKNMQQAMEFIRKRDDCSKAEAWKKARKEFVQFFTYDNKQTSESEEA